MIVLVCLEPTAPSLASQAALRIANSLGEKAETVVLWAGGDAEGATLAWVRQCASIRRIVHLQDALLAKADFVTLGMILAETARHLGARVILMGEHSDTEGQGMVPAALAHHLKVPYFARVEGAELPASQDGSLHVILRSGGRLCKVSSPLPAVLAVPPSGLSSTVEGRDNMVAVEHLTLDQVGLDASRIVPRPHLLGDHVSAPPETIQHTSFDEAARILLQGQ